MKRISIALFLVFGFLATGCTVGKIEAYIVCEKPTFKAEYDLVPVRVGGAFQGEDGLLHLVLLRDEVRKTLFTARTTFRGIDLLEARLLNGKLAAVDYWRITEGVSERYVLKTGKIDIDSDAEPVRGLLQGEFELKEQRPPDRPKKTLFLRCWFRLPKSEPHNLDLIKADVEKAMAGENVPLPEPDDSGPIPEKGP
ncbi:MAG: hypothetical protein ACYS8W_11625 [Planctomycetota bacterium]|jgi:hypothetical protein